MCEKTKCAVSDIAMCEKLVSFHILFSQRKLCFYVFKITPNTLKIIKIIWVCPAEKAGSGYPLNSRLTKTTAKKPYF
jgi:hypothetical protein